MSDSTLDIVVAALRAIGEYLPYEDDKIKVDSTYWYDTCTNSTIKLKMSSEDVLVFHYKGGQVRTLREGKWIDYIQKLGDELNPKKFVKDKCSGDYTPIDDSSLFG